MQYVGVGRWGTTQTTAYTGTAGTVGSNVSLGVNRVRILVTTDAYVKVGKSPTATTSDVYVAALSPEYVIVNPGEAVSAVQVSVAGSVSVTEVL